jgi:apolipoprotein N-acyltransferase
MIALPVINLGRGAHLQSRAATREAALKLAQTGLRCAFAAVLGGLAALSLAPFFLTPLLFVAFTGLLWLVGQARSRRGALFFGWLFGIGYFAVGLSWIAESFYVDAEQFGALAVPAVAGLSAFLALFPALACWIAKAIGGTGWRLLLAFSASWSATEWLRGHVLTGFPWNLIGYAWGVTDETLQAASLFGIYGLGFITALIAALPGLMVGNHVPKGLWRWCPLVTSLAGVIALWGFGAVRLAHASGSDTPDVRLRIVQANIPQTMKWDPTEADRILGRYTALSTKPASIQPTHIIWPETAIPYLIAEGAIVLEAIAAVVPSDGALLTGAVRPAENFETRPALLNSLVALNAAGMIVEAYDKVRLVPFGEYMPLRRVLPLEKLTEGSIDYTPGDVRTVITAPGLPPAGPMICYESIFPNTSWQGGEPRWLLNVTNDAWFGVSSGPYQHFLASRVRAVEEGLPVVRAANTGISAVIDPYGRVREALELNADGVIDANLPDAIAGKTFFATFGDLPLGSAVLVTLMIVIATRSRPTTHLCIPDWTCRN